MMNNEHDADCGHTDEEHEAMRQQIRGMLDERTKLLADHMEAANALLRECFNQPEPAVLNDPTWESAVNISMNYLNSKGMTLRDIDLVVSIFPAIIKMTIIRHEAIKAERQLPAWMDGIEIDL